MMQDNAKESRLKKWQEVSAWPIIVLSFGYIAVYVIPIYWYPLHPGLSTAFHIAEYIIWAVFIFDYVVQMISLGDAEQMLGIHRTTAWAIHDRGDFPVPVIKVGGQWRVVRAHLHHFINTGERVTLPFSPVSDSTFSAR